MIMSLIENHPEFELMCDKHEHECSMRGGDYVTPTPPIEHETQPLDYVVDDKTEELHF